MSLSGLAREDVAFQELVGTVGQTDTISQDLVGWIEMRRHHIEYLVRSLRTNRCSLAKCSWLDWNEKTSNCKNWSGTVRQTYTTFQYVVGWSSPR